MILAHGFTEYNFQARVQKWRSHHRKLINTHVAQKIASTVWRKFQAYLYGNGDEIRFAAWADFCSIEGKNNESGIVFRDGAVEIARRKFPVKLAKAPREGFQPSPSYTYEQEALSHKVKYCRITRRWYPAGWKYFVQLILEGEPPVKVNPKTGEVNHILFGDGCRQRCGDTLLCGDIPYRVNEMNASLAAINSKKDGLQLSRALQNTAKQWHHGGLTGHQLGTPRIYSWEQSVASLSSGVLRARFFCYWTLEVSGSGDFI